MNGYGRGRGGSRRGARITAPAGYSYVGTCRCGFGPHAYYRGPDGQIVPAAAAFAAPGTAVDAAEMEALRAEKAELERKLREK